MPTTSDPAQGTPRLQPRRSRRWNNSVAAPLSGCWVRCHDGLNATLKGVTLFLLMKTYFIKPTMTRTTIATNVRADKSATLPPRQPLPRPVIDPNRQMIKLGLDVHLAFIMAVIQRGHGPA